MISKKVRWLFVLAIVEFAGLGTFRSASAQTMQWLADLTPPLRTVASGHLDVSQDDGPVAKVANADSVKHAKFDVKEGALRVHPDTLASEGVVELLVAPAEELDLENRDAIVVHPPVMAVSRPVDLEMRPRLNGGDDFALAAMSGETNVGAIEQPNLNQPDQVEMFVERGIVNGSEYPGSVTSCCGGNCGGSCRICGGRVAGARLNP